MAMIFLVVIVLLYQNNVLKQELISLKDTNAIQKELIDNKEDKIKQITNDYEETLTVARALEKENQELTEKIEASKIVDYVTKLKLERMDIDNYESIEKDLISKPELISIDGVLGGTMFFTDAHLLNEKWVYATFEDGHIMGSGLYTYEVFSPEEIKWKEIEVTSD